MPRERFPKRSPEASFRPMGDEGGLVVLPTRREIKVLNPVGIRVFGLLDGSLSEAQIVDLVAKEFEVGRDQAARDVGEFLGELRAAGMLAEEDRPEPAGHEVSG